MKEIAHPTYKLLNGSVQTLFLKQVCFKI